MTMGHDGADTEEAEVQVWGVGVGLSGHTECKGLQAGYQGGNSFQVSGGGYF